MSVSTTMVLLRGVKGNVGVDTIVVPDGHGLMASHMGVATIRNPYLVCQLSLSDNQGYKEYTRLGSIGIWRSPKY